MNKYGHDFFYFTGPNGRRITLAYRYTQNPIFGNHEAELSWTSCSGKDRYEKSKGRKIAMDMFNKRSITLIVDSTKESDFIKALVNKLNASYAIRCDIMGSNCKNYLIEPTAEGTKGFTFKHT